MSQVGLAYVRGCEIEGMLDGGGRVIEEGPGPRPHVAGDTRTFRVVMDANQYKIDLDGISKGEEVRSRITTDFTDHIRVLMLCFLEIIVAGRVRDSEYISQT